MIKHYTRYILLLIISSLVVACGPQPTEVPTLVATAAVDLVETGSVERPVGDPLNVVVNWCGGTANYVARQESTLTRLVQVNIGGEAEIETAIGKEGLTSVKGRIASFQALSIGTEITWDWGGEATVAPGTYVIFDLQPIEIWNTGNVTVSVPVIGSRQYSYEVLSALRTNVINSENIPCDEAPSITGTLVASSATAPAPLLQVVSEDDFSRTDWYNNPVAYRNYSGICDYEGDGMLGRLVSISDEAGFCSFTVMNPNGAEYIPLNTVGVYSGDVGLESGSGFLGQGIGLFSETGWWMVCTLRQDNTNSFFAVMETQDPASFNQYLIASSGNARVTLTVTDDTIQCSHNGQVTGRIPFAEIPVAADSPVVLVVNSDRPSGTAVTTIDNIVLQRAVE